ncbi:thermonuclease family protein [Deefgea piscis]|uniref:thermonuclease family protein n=1 Tax=Deefgea piscis TaxID=2739061 RepID=UPI001C806DBD|nr:thermonuclease family protein [Deefgea piscis]QZA82263.1 thermonuclease family protein [Deefgea piscis]
MPHYLPLLVKKSPTANSYSIEQPKLIESALPKQHLSEVLCPKLQCSNLASPHILRMINMSKLVLVLVLSLCFTQSFAETLSGRIVGVSDGDTATLLTTANKSVKIRLAQIDAPEKAQAFGAKSKQSLSDLIYGKAVSVEVETKDRYGRTVGKIIVNGIDANLEQIKRGMAWFYVQYGRDSTYRDAELRAKTSRTGLWADMVATPPWEFRHGKKTGQSVNVNQTNSANAGNCGSKRYCKEMASCDEAKFYLQQCGVRTIDGDGDGIPCDKLCR